MGASLDIRMKNSVFLTSKTYGSFEVRKKAENVFMIEWEETSK